MLYNIMQMDVLLHDLVVFRPLRQKATAVIEGMDESYDLNALPPVLQDLMRAGIQNVVVDLSKFSSDKKRPALPVIYCMAGMLSLNVGYSGIAAKEIEAYDAGINGLWLQHSSQTIDDAVRRFR